MHVVDLFIYLQQHVCLHAYEHIHKSYKQDFCCHQKEMNQKLLRVIESILGSNSEMKSLFPRI